MRCDFCELEAKVLVKMTHEKLLCDDCSKMETMICRECGEMADYYDVLRSRPDGVTFCESCRSPESFEELEVL